MDILSTSHECPLAESTNAIPRTCTGLPWALRGPAFVVVARRAKQAGFDGVEIHGAHGYILCQFLSPGINHRSDRYGGSLANRARLILEIIVGIRAVCGREFLLGIRLSPEGHGLFLAEIQEFVQDLFRAGEIDFLDMSLWDCFKEPEEEVLKGQTLIQCFYRSPTR